MAAVDYAAKAATAKRLLVKFGQVGAIRRTVKVGGGPTDPTGGTTVDVDYPATLVVLLVDGKDVDGTVIRTGDWSVIIEAIEIEITTADKIVCTEGTLSILDTGRIAPSGVTVVYDSKARG